MRSIDSSQWKTFSQRFTSAHDGWSATLQLREPSGAMDLAVEDRPFRGLTLESHLGNEALILTFGDDSDEHLTHTIEHPRKVTVHDPNPAECALIVTLPDGSDCVLELANPLAE